MHIPKYLRLAAAGTLAGVVMTLLSATSASAATSLPPARGGIPFIYNTGQDAFRSGPIPGDWAQEPALAGFAAGYLCDIKGVMWSYYSVSNCKAVAFKDNEYYDDTELVAAITAAYPPSSMERSFWNRYGWMGMVALVLLGAATWLWGRLGRFRKHKDTSAPVPVSEG